MQRVGREGRRIVLVELDQRAHQLGRARMAGGVGIGLELALARIAAGERLHEEQELGQHHEEQHQRRGIARRVHAEALVEPGLVDQLSEHPQHGEADGGGERHALRDVVQAVMAELVREHRFDFRRLEPAHQRVEQHDALGGAETGEEGVAVARALRAVHQVQAARLEAAALEQPLDALGELALADRRELVEQRHDESGIDHHQHERVADPQDPDVEPPVFAHLVHQPEHRE